MPEVISSFKGKYSFLSNFYLVPHRVFGYPTVEHFFQAMKINLPSAAETIAARQPFKTSNLSAGAAKKMGRAATLRDDWEDIKDEVMKTGLMVKFNADYPLASRLIDTGDAILIEGNNWHDNYWGKCSCGPCVAFHPGQNKLGELLMEVRGQLCQS